MSLQMEISLQIKISFKKGELYFQAVKGKGKAFPASAGSQLS